MSLGRRSGAILAAALAMTACTGEPSFDEELVDSVSTPERVTLADGGELVVSDRRDRYVAQWRERGADGWTEARTVAEGTDLETGGAEITTGGDAAVVAVDWWAADDDEHDGFARSDAAICHDLTCDVVEDVVEPPMIDAAGAFAVVATDTDTPAVAVWRTGAEGWERLRLAGLPEVEGGWRRAPDVRLLPDGRLVAVIGRQASAGCTFELWAGAPGRTELAVAAATAPRGQEHCYAENVSVADKTLAFYNRAIDEVVTFVDADGVWTDDQPTGDAGLLSVDPAAGLPMTLTELDDGSSVALGSPDLRRVVAQRRPAGSTEWTEPRQVAEAPAGQECHSARSETIYQATDVLYLVQCWPAGSPWGGEYDDAPPPTTGVAVASADGSAWTAQPLDRPAYQPLVQSDAHLLVARGGERSLVWRSGAGRFDVVRLPLANPTVDALAVAGDSAIRVTGNPDPAAPCVPTWSVAPLDARRWGTPAPIAPIPDWAAGAHDCYGVIIDRAELSRTEKPDRAYRVAAVIGDLNGAIAGVLSRAGDGWSFESSER
ncbi:hypothetical protein [Nocardioides nitrophenolicus]|uniref:hypothetical protein n=1 Tax=Nocardioides nitrophenolicus TaxID=60489 RepID=UPI001959B79D|nr:hypothetical protein [Nocardioides nitrophenolicus]MBM7517139.1 hypothetical protein [Nocardioides nitrophenolicus]